MDAANDAATATISNWGTTVAFTDHTVVDTLVGWNVTDHTTPDATALRECHFGEQQQHPCQRCEQAGEMSARVGHGAIIAARRGEKEKEQSTFYVAGHTRVTSATNSASQPWTEVWSMEACGTLVDINVTFSPSPKGGIDCSIALPPSPRR